MLNYQTIKKIINQNMYIVYCLLNSLLVFILNVAPYSALFNKLFSQLVTFLSTLLKQCENNYIQLSS